MTQQFEWNPEKGIESSYNQDQDNAITCIKQIGKQILEINDEHQFIEKLELERQMMKKKERQKYKYQSMTERKVKSNVFDSVHEDEWISDFQLETDRQTIIEEGKSSIDKKNMSDRKKKLKEGYLRPVGNFKKETIEYIEEKRKREERQLNIHKKKTMPLSKLYEQKKPLYDKFMQNKKRKETKIKVHKYIKKCSQTDGLTLHPEINHNYSLPSFQKRQQIAKQNAKHKETQIFNDYLRQMTFKPTTNVNQKSESKVKSIWKKKGKEDDQVVQLKGISQSMIKTGSFFSDENSINNNNKNFEVPLQAVDELSYVFEIEDIIQ